MNIVELKVEMLRRNINVTELATILCKSKSAISKQLNGVNEFTRKDIAAIKDALNLTPERIDEIFFTTNVDFKSTSKIS